MGRGGTTPSVLAHEPGKEALAPLPSVGLEVHDAAGGEIKFRSVPFASAKWSRTRASLVYTVAGAFYVLVTTAVDFFLQGLDISPADS